MRAGTYAMLIIIGILFGLWFGGTFIDHRVTLNGAPISHYSPEQITNELMNNGGTIESSSHFVAGQVEVLSASGSWFMILAMLLAGSIPLVACLVVERILKRRKGANKKLKPNANASAE